MDPRQGYTLALRLPCKRIAPAAQHKPPVSGHLLNTGYWRSSQNHFLTVKIQFANEIVKVADKCCDEPAARQKNPA